VIALPAQVKRVCWLTGCLDWRHPGNIPQSLETLDFEATERVERESRLSSLRGESRPDSKRRSYWAWGIATDQNCKRSVI
jgi:hypothetical protein